MLTIFKRINHITEKEDKLKNMTVARKGVE
nr:MAG TPA: hypothetical protein [Caudoviricetes sp.]